MTGNVLDPAALISLLPTLLPEESKTLKSPQDGLAALVHTIMITVAFRLIAIDETSTSLLTSNVLPLAWNQNGPAHYTFKYRHEQSSLEYVMKVTKLGGRTLVNGVALESDKVASLDLSTNDFVSPSFFPSDLAADDKPTLIHGYISSNRVSDFVSQFKLAILQKLAPGLHKEGYAEESVPQASGASGSRAPQNYVPPPARPNAEPPFGPEDFQVPRLPSRNPLEIGRRDWDPFPQNPYSPPSLFPGGGDGMYVGPNHPIFGAGRGRGRFGDRDIWGGDGFLPPGAVPPGARFDPVGPLSPFGGGRGRGRGGPPQHFGEPDNDEFMPPGMDNMYM